MATSILAQNPLDDQRRAVQTPPPPVTFTNWRQAETTEFSQEYDVSFPSALTTPYPENDMVRVRAFLPTDALRAVPVVVILHYWGATDISLETQMARDLNTVGIGAVVMQLPYHLSRTPRGTRSGQLALQPDTGKLVATMTQSVLDVRRTVDWIQSRSEFDGSKIGLAGTSLGGIVSALVYGLEDRFRAGTFVLAGADIAGILWNSSRVVEEREALRRKGYSLDRLRRELAAIEPSAYLRPDDGRPELVISATLDTVVPPEFTQVLEDRLGQPSTVRLPTGHFGGALQRGRIVRAVSRFFEDTFAGRQFTSPAAIKAPTLWFGLTLTPERGLQVSASVDLWRNQSQRGPFASAVLTPHGFQGFVGQGFGRGFAVGVALLPRKVTPGMMWRVAF